MGPQPGVTLSYGYDALDRRVSMSDSLGGTTAYVWDVEDRLETLTAPWGTVYAFSYDGEGRRTSLSSTTGRTSSYGYTNGLLSTLRHVQSGTVVTDLAYSYGPDGQLTEILDQLDPSKSRFISYDALNRLIQVDEGVPPINGGVPNPVEDYAYDEEGNRTASHLSAMYSSSAHNQLESDDSYTYAYDDRGNRVSRTSKTTGAVEAYTYDSQNRLIGYTDGTTTATYAYDAVDRRIAKTVDGTTEAFVHDPWSGNSVANDIVLDFTSGNLTRRWLHGSQIDEPLSFEAYGADTTPGAGSVSELYADRLGSITSVVDATTGTVTASATYDGFGARTTTGQPPRYGFTGREHDAESGLIHFRARAYDTMLRQFLQRDPIGFAAGDLNLYAYVWNDPYNWSDPSGLDGTAGAIGTMSRQEALRRAATTAVVVSTLGLAGMLGYQLATIDIPNVLMNKDEEPKEERSGIGGNGGPPLDDPAAEENKDPNWDDWEDRLDLEDDPYEWTDHALEEMMDEDISPEDIYDDIESPVNVRPGSSEKGPTTVYEGERATAVLNENGTIVTVWQ